MRDKCQCDDRHYADHYRDCPERHKAVPKDKYQGHTPGPWTITGHVVSEKRQNTRVSISHACTNSSTETDANARLIADAPALLARVERLEGLLRRWQKETGEVADAALCSPDHPLGILDEETRVALAGEEEK